mmetsp:Transcript_28355/g.59225  ORF Transcript_28355/g.59225 Transcript_28355/m.59225 type:complete len:82 (-) Transcript_28355:3759-4004(-)
MEWCPLLCCFFTGRPGKSALDSNLYYSMVVSGEGSSDLLWCAVRVLSNLCFVKDNSLRPFCGGNHSLLQGLMTTALTLPFS